MNASPTDFHASRFIVGIDLGTTNSAVCYVDTVRDRTLRQFLIPQLVEAGETASLPVLPSFCLLPAPGQYSEGALDLPWARGRDYAVGMFARNEAARTPGRVVASTKSWLAHAGVDRTRPILPWGEDLGDQKISPVEVSRRFLLHIREAWNHVFGRERDENGNPCFLEDQQVIVTVPASFDEAARRLTLEAARGAGLDNVELLEEPLAAFYAWLAAHERDWSQALVPDSAVLIVDVGGGTTDFTIVRFEEEGILRRTAVGDHILLGGDNMDAALARRIEQQWSTQLDHREWRWLCNRCRDAKERLLAPEAPESEPLALSRTGRAVVGGVLRAELKTREIRSFLCEGFFPRVPADAPPPPRGSGMRRMGLPYAQDAAVTRHLLGFLRGAAGASPADRTAAPLKVSAVLFNGGALYPEAFRRRVLETLAAWYGDGSPVAELEHDDLSLAVSRGAAYYGLVRRGRGVHVAGGAPRSFYLEVAAGETPAVVCILPRGVREGTVVETPRSLLLEANRPARFAAYSSATRLGDRPGDILRDTSELTPLPPLYTVIRHGRKGVHKRLPVQVHAQVHIVGTLDLWCQVRGENRRYPLSFDLRGRAAEESAVVRTAGAAPEDVTVAQDVLDQAAAALKRGLESDADAQGLTRILERTLGLRRANWSARILRSFADVLLDLGDAARATPVREARWLNLIGFCLRPGAGFPGDEWRVRRLWKRWPAGPRHPNKPAVQVEWWLCWRRTAGGLKSGQQEQVAAPLLRELASPKAARPGPSPRYKHAAAEMWRCLGALERIPIPNRLRVIDLLCRHVPKLASHHWWAMARMAARKPLFAGPETVIPADPMTPYARRIIEYAERKPSRNILFAITMACRVCGVRSLDLSEDVRRRARAVLAAHNAPAEWQEMLVREVDESNDFRTEAAADALPLGLHLVS